MNSYRGFKYKEKSSLFYNGAYKREGFMSSEEVR